MTTIDSPSAMITTIPWRSTKCSTETTKPSMVARRGVRPEQRGEPQSPLRVTSERTADEHEQKPRS